jgi:hypothetical protein
VWGGKDGDEGIDDGGESSQQGGRSRNAY